MPLLFYAGLDRDEYRRYLPWTAELCKNVLWTYFDFRDDYGEKYFVQAMDQLSVFAPETRVFLDSGAYSAFTQNKPISVTEYLHFLYKYHDVFYMIASLDNKADQRETYENYHTLRKEGFTVAPVWHAVGGDFGILREYMEDPDVPMVCVGAIAKERITDQAVYKRLDAVFHLVGKHKKPIHAFGRTEPELLTKYPFTSADSVTWQNGGWYGLVLKWNPVSRTLRNIKLRDPAGMEREFGPKAKVLLGQVPEDKFHRPLYHYQTHHNLAETLKEQEDLEAYWTNRGVVWDYNAIDLRNLLTDDTIEDCKAARKAAGYLMPGDEEHIPGMYSHHLLKKKNFRPSRKWEADVENVATTYEILVETEFKERLLYLETARKAAGI